MLKEGFASFAFALITGFVSAHVDKSFKKLLIALSCAAAIFGVVLIISPNEESGVSGGVSGVLLEQSSVDDNYLGEIISSGSFGQAADYLSKNGASTESDYESIYQACKYLDSLDQSRDSYEIIKCITEFDLADHPWFADLYDYAKEDYLSFVVAQARSLQGDDPEAYNALINKAMALIPDNELIETLYECRPQDLFQMQEFVGDVGDFVYYNEGTTDNTGQNRRYVITCTSLYANSIGFREVTYKLNGNYDVLTFTLGLSSTDNDTSLHGWLEFRSEGNTLFSTDGFTAGSEPKTYSIPVSGVDELVLTAKCDGSEYSLGSYVDLISSEFWLTKNI